MNEGNSGVDQRNGRLWMLSRAFHGDRLAQAVAKHPGDTIAQAARVTVVGEVPKESPESLKRLFVFSAFLALYLLRLG